MAHLGQGDVRRLRDFLFVLYRPRRRAAFGAEIISLLPSIVSCDSCSYNELSLKGSDNTYISYPQSPALADHLSIFNRYVHEHPLLRAYKKLGASGGAGKFSDFVSQTQFHRSGIYNEYYRPLRIRHQIGLSIAEARGKSGTAIALNRTGATDFDEHDRLCLNLLHPHLQQAFRNADLLTRLEEEISLLSRGIEALHHQFAILNRNGSVRHMSPKMQRLISAGFGGASMRNECLPEDVLRWFRDSKRGSNGLKAPQLFPFWSGGRQFVLRLIPGHEEWLLLASEQCRSFPSEGLAEWGLTSREAEVLSWICRGKTNADIAEILGISPRTVGKHVERILPKLGVETRTAAVSAVQRLTMDRQACWDTLRF